MGWRPEKRKCLSLTSKQSLYGTAAEEDCIYFSLAEEGARMANGGVVFV